MPTAAAACCVRRPSAGARITGVDDSTFSSTGEAFSTIVLPRSDSHREKSLQSDDVSLAYEQAAHRTPFRPHVARSLLVCALACAQICKKIPWIVSALPHAHAPSYHAHS
jgi:hypothetical protein